ncbi:SIP domain-containing protein [Streptomyces sp. NPDC000348]|uniref:SIP domain-containing protein n=1 Tax=Streptomyces sp. NPDC000348 TaxID=3364538 RepID=UPI00367A6523
MHAAARQPRRGHREGREGRLTAPAGSPPRPVRAPRRSRPVPSPRPPGRAGGGGSARPRSGSPSRAPVHGTSAPTGVTGPGRRSRRVAVVPRGATREAARRHREGRASTGKAVRPPGRARSPAGPPAPPSATGCRRPAPRSQATARSGSARRRTPARPLRADGTAPPATEAVPETPPAGPRTRARLEVPHSGEDQDPATGAEITRSVRGAHDRGSPTAPDTLRAAGLPSAGRPYVRFAEEAGRARRSRGGTSRAVGAPTAGG